MIEEKGQNDVTLYIPEVASATAQVTIDEIIDALLVYQPHADVELVRKAYELANAAHAGQKRASGEEYIIHPLCVAKILTELHIDATTITAALLHDVVEDTTYSQSQMEDIFGVEVAMLIDGVTKLGKIKFQSKEEQQSENYRKLFLAMAKDIRVIMIKLADRLHNMRTLKFVKEEKQQRIARETIEVYAPLANRLGISNIKWELEDLCLRYLEPEFYYRLVEDVKQKRQERQRFIEDSILQIHTKLIRSSIKADISGRAKHFYSIYRKMKRQNKDLSEIFDLSAVRVLVHNVKDCYAVLGVIHAMWKPIPGRFKDYIAMPKTNGYQSLHTTVMTRGYPLEIQIRTFAMHKVSEFGVAAHWKYKETGKSTGAGGTDYEKKISWLRQMMTLQHEVSDPGEYLDALKMDIFSDEVFVFTPSGDVIDLPKGSVPIDFAYRIHTEVGHHCVGAKVNGKIVPLEYKLKNGDQVSIITNKSNNGPSRDWLNIVAGSETRAKIRSWFKKVKREENIVRGRELLEKEAKRLGYEPKDLLRDEWLNSVCLRFNINSDEDMLATIGYGGIAVNGVIAKLIEHHKKAVKEATPANVTQMLDEIKQHRSTKRSKSSHGILVEGESGMLVRLARCCNPIPGDPITGYITKGRGVSVHRADCPNVLSDDGDTTRVIDVNWDVGLDKDYTVEIEINCNDTAGVLTSVLSVPAEMKINVSSVNARANRNNKTSTIIMGLDVHNAAQVSSVMTRIRRLKDIFSVSRAMSSNVDNNTNTKHGR